MSYNHADAHPPRPVIFEGDFPASTPPGEIRRQREAIWRKEEAEAHPSVEFEFARDEREELARRAISGPLGQRGGVYPFTPAGALSPREAQRELDYQEAIRLHAGGLPDSPEDMPAVAVIGGPPAVFQGD